MFDIKSLVEKQHEYEEISYRVRNYLNPKIFLGLGDEIDTLEDIVVWGKLASKIDNSSNGSTDYYRNFILFIERKFKNTEDKKYFKKEHDYDTNFYYYKPKTIKFKDGILGESFLLFGTNTREDWYMQTVDEPKDKVDLFGYGTRGEKHESTWFKFYNKDLNQINKKVNTKFEEYKELKEKGLDSKPLFEKNLLELYYKLEEESQETIKHLDERKLEKKISNLQGKYDEELAFSYFPELIALHNKRMLCKKFNMTYEECSYIYYNLAFYRKFSNEQLNAALEDYIYHLTHNIKYRFSSVKYTVPGYIH